MQKQMYSVDTPNEAERTAEQRLSEAARRIQEIDQEVERLQEERAGAAHEINRATGELQESSEKAQHILSANAKVETPDANW